MNLFKRTTGQMSFRSSLSIKGDMFIKSAPKNGTFYPNDLQRESEELLRCKKQKIYTENVFPVEIIDYNKETDELTTKFIPGTINFFNLIWNTTSILNRIQRRLPSHDLLISRCEEIGKWLSMYHNSSPFPQSSQEAMESLKYFFKRKIKRIQEQQLVKKKFLCRVEEVYLAEIENLVYPSYLEEHRIKICIIHEDFSPPNLLIDEKFNICIIDFANARIGTSLEDVGRLYEWLYAIGQTSRYRKVILSEALDAFLKGYGLPLEIKNDPFFITIRAYNGMINCISNSSQKKHLSLISNMVNTRIVNASLGWISHQLATPW